MPSNLVQVGPQTSPSGRPKSRRLGCRHDGAGIAYATATKGIAVVLKDISLENAEKAKLTRTSF